MASATISSTSPAISRSAARCRVNAPSAGYYRLFNYDTLTASSFGTITGSSSGTPTVLTNIDHQVNLSVLAAGQQMQFWDGADQTGNGIVNGGAGTWSTANTNWTGMPGQAGINDQWRGSVGVFGDATAGAITVVGTQAFDTLQFSTTGYVLSAGAGGQLQLAGPSGTGTINTDTGITTTINTPIVDGSAQNLGKVGGGTLIFGGSSTYTGTTTVTAGTLDVEGSIASSLMTTVNVGSKLTGNGTVGNTTINGGGIFAPGSGMPGSSMTVAGNLALQSGAQYVVMLNPSSSSFATVTGTAALSGATVNAMFAAGSYVGKQYTIVNTTGGLGGSTFSALVNSNLPSGFKTSLSYDANSAYLDLALLFIPPPNSGLSGNQSGVGNALINYFNKNGGIPLVFGGLTTAGLTQVSGETATGGLQTTFNAMTQFMGMMTDPFTAGRGVDEPGAPAFADDALAYAAKRKPVDAFAMFTKAPPVAPTFEARWSVWASGFGGSQTTNGNTSSGSNTVSSSIGGTAVGADALLSPTTVAGFSLAGVGSRFSVANGGSGHSDMFQAGAFVRHRVSSAYITAAAAYGWQDITTDRTVTVAGIDRLHAQFNANSLSGRVEGGNRYVTSWLGGVGLTPYIAAQVVAFDLPAYAEIAAGGANTFALTYAGKTVTSTRSELGLRSDKSFAVADTILTLRGRAAWAHDYNTDRSIAATFQSLPGASFTVSGAAPARDAALTTASAEMTFISGISLAATFEGEFSDVTRSYAGKGVVRYRW